MQASNILILPQENCKLPLPLLHWGSDIITYMTKARKTLGWEGDASSEFLGGSLLALMMEARPIASSKKSETISKQRYLNNLRNGSCH